LQARVFGVSLSELWLRHFLAARPANGVFYLVKMEAQIRAGKRNIDVVPVEHWNEIWENGRFVAILFKTFHPAIPFEIYMKIGSNAVKRVSTIGEAIDFILENLKALENAQH